MGRRAHDLHPFKAGIQCDNCWSICVAGDRWFLTTPSHHFIRRASVTWSVSTRVIRESAWRAYTDACSSLCIGLGCSGHGDHVSRTDNTFSPKRHSQPLRHVTGTVTHLVAARRQGTRYPASTLVTGHPAQQSRNARPLHTWNPGQLDANVHEPSPSRTALPHTNQPAAYEITQSPALDAGCNAAVPGPADHISSPPACAAQHGRAERGLLGAEPHLGATVLGQGVVPTPGAAVVYKRCEPRCPSQHE